MTCVRYMHALPSVPALPDRHHLQLERNDHCSHVMPFCNLFILAASLGGVVVAGLQKALLSKVSYPSTPSWYPDLLARRAGRGHRWPCAFVLAKTDAASDGQVLLESTHAIRRDSIVGDESKRRCVPAASPP